MFRLMRVCCNCKKVIFLQRCDKRTSSKPIIYQNKHWQLTKQNPGLNRMLEANKITEEDLKTLVNFEEEFDYDAEDYDSAIFKADSLYDKHVSEEASKNVKIKKKIIEKKYFKSPKELNLLTWAAKEQIRYLHNEDPKEWPPERLAQSFPISEEGVKKLLRSKFVSATPERQRKHDQAVVRNWKAVLGSTGGPVSASVNYLKAPEEEKLFLQNATGNPNLPMPPPKLHDPDPVKPKKTGEFLSIVKHYLDTKDSENKSDQKEVDDKMNNIFIDENDSDTLKGNNKKTPLITADQYKRTLKKQIENLKATEKSSVVAEYQSWLNEEKSSAVFPKSKLKEMQQKNSVCKENNDYLFEKSEVKLNWDVREEVKHRNIKEAYIYSSKTGYQRPLGKVEEAQDKIHIPLEKYKRNATYRVGNNYYDEYGDFLFKVPGLGTET